MDDPGKQSVAYTRLAMFFSLVILVVSTALFFFYVQATCQKILRRQFDQEFFKSVINAYCLEFPSVRKAIEEGNGPPDYSPVRTKLKVDFLTLNHLLRHAGNSKQGYSGGHRLLRLYFRTVLFSLAVRHLLGVGEENVIRKLAAVLQYFANVVGQQLKWVGMASQTPSEYISSL